jgi:lysophospholipase L1-like esterase
MHSLKVAALNIAIVGVLLFAADRLLAVFGYPAEVPLKSAHRANVQKTLKTIEFEYEFSTNNLGLRYGPISVDKPPGSTRILLLGDSFTEGVGVEAAESFPSLLQKHYSEKAGQEVPFINAGLGGEGPLQFWRVFFDIGLALSPDGLLICLYANDLMDTPEMLSREDLYRRVPERHGLAKFIHGILPRVDILIREVGRIISRELRQSEGFVATVTELAREQDISDSAIESWRNRLPGELVEASDRSEFNKSLLSMGLFRPNYWEEAINITTPVSERKFQSMRLALDEITTIAREKEMAIGLIYIPAPLQYDASRHESWNPWIIGGVEFKPEWVSEDAEIQKRLAHWAQKKNIPFLDLTPTLRSEIQAGAKLNFKLDGHWNADGHRVAGKAITEWIDRYDVFPVLRHAREGS